MELPTKSIQLETQGTHGPKFDNFGELLEWLFEQPEIVPPDPSVE